MAATAMTQSLPTSHLQEVAGDVVANFGEDGLRMELDAFDGVAAVADYGIDALADHCPLFPSLINSLDFGLAISQSPIFLN